MAKTFAQILSSVGLRSIPATIEGSELFVAYITELDVALQAHWGAGCTWEALCGDSRPIVQAIEAKEDPVKFSKWWGEKYDLIENNPYQPI